MCKSVWRRQWRWRRDDEVASLVSGASADCDADGSGVPRMRRRRSGSTRMAPTGCGSVGMEMALPRCYLLDSGIAIVSLWRQRYTFGQHPVVPFFSRSTTLSQQFKAPAIFWIQLRPMETDKSRYRVRVENKLSRKVEMTY